jgi:3-dehydroquinate synthase
MPKHGDERDQSSGDQYLQVGRPVRIFLTGMMGAGKSTVASFLAQAIGGQVLDLDEQIERRVGIPTAAYLAQLLAQEGAVVGEAKFRAVERETLEALLASLDGQGAVIATGGGAVLERENRRSMRRFGVIVYLEVEAQELVRRLSKPAQQAARPLLAGTDLADRVNSLLAARRQAYLDCDLRVDAHLPAHEVAVAIATRLGLNPAMPSHAESIVGAEMGESVPVGVPLPEKDYAVHVAPGLLAHLGAVIARCHPRAKRVALVSDTNVMPIYGGRARASIAASGLQVDSFEVPAGEASKNHQELLRLVEGFIEAGLSRHDVVVALGGGVIGDLAGLAAATFMRGIPFIQCPTSLLAQVDASVGGKVAIDLPSGKNLFGVFHFPSAVLIDPDVLTTLDQRERSCGLAEMLKHALLFSKEHFALLREQAPAILRSDRSVLTRLIAQSVRFKAECVAGDPFEMGAGAGAGRALLNLGHTVGHAIENISNFSCKHGEAVALGLVAAARLSHTIGLAPATLEPEIVTTLRDFALPTQLDTWLDVAHRDALLNYLARDKKRRGSGLDYVALRAIGEPQIVNMRPEDVLSSILNKS